jgi:hypothetical protein
LLQHGAALATACPHGLGRHAERMVQIENCDSLQREATTEVCLNSIEACVKAGFRTLLAATKTSEKSTCVHDIIEDPHDDCI